MSTLRKRITDIAEAEYQARDFAAVAEALNTQSIEIVDHTLAGYERAATVLSTAEIAAVLTALEAFARSEHPSAGLTAHGLRKFSASDLDFALPESQELILALPTISGGAITEDVATRLAALGVRHISAAEADNAGTPYTAADVEQLWIDEQKDLLRQHVDTGRHAARTLIHDATGVPEWPDIVAAFATGFTAEPTE